MLMYLAEETFYCLVWLNIILRIDETVFISRDENTDPADGGCPLCSQIDYSKIHDPILMEVWTRKPRPKVCVTQ